ncbi:MAG: AAA family ATPase, partial [Myxococcales bacterium]|nr:AAA family ATPase [Myxococcales bacterium]
MPALPIGESDFESLRHKALLYIDKSHFVHSLLTDGAQVLVFPAPRRFGKSLTLSMLHAFFDDQRSEESRDALFAGLAITKNPDAWAQRGQHPVIHLSLKDTDAATASQFRAALASQLGSLARRLESRLGAASIHAVEREQLRRLIDESPDDIDLRRALERLVKWLGEATGKKVLVLIDEYDAPVHRAQESERDAIVELLRNLFSAGLKDNAHLYKGILTGVLRIGKESMFSGLNHVAVHTMLTAKYSTAFGFDEFEVAMLAKARGVLHRFADLEDWYDGFMSGTRRVFNPWSVLSALSDLEATPDLPLRPYWSNTGDPKRLTGLIERHAAANGPYLEELLSGKSVRRPLAESVAFSDLDQSPDATWAFLVYTGYLTAELMGSEEADFRIPNQEARLELVRIS